MIDHRRLQRTLFRAQMDPSFAAQLFEGSEPEHALIRQASRAGITADPRGTRRLQVLGNATLEFRLSLAGCDDPLARLEDFASSVEFHAAIEHDLPLPLAAGAYLCRVLADQAWPSALAELELALAQVRRQNAGPQAPPDCWQRASRAAVIDLPVGSVARAAEIQAALHAGKPCPENPAPPSEHLESILVYARAGTNPWALADAIPEEVNEAVAALFRRAEQPLDAQALDTFATEFDATASDLLPLMHEYRSEGALVYGS
jgi:hypothetical protein